MEHLGNGWGMVISMRRREIEINHIDRLVEKVLSNELFDMMRMESVPVALPLGSFSVILLEVWEFALGMNGNTLILGSNGD